MNRRNLIAAGIVAACVGVGLGVLATLPESRISKMTYERIKKGMTAEQVQAVVGMPPTDEIAVRDAGHMSLHAAWTNPDGSGFAVFVDEAGLYEKTWYDSNETIGEKIRRWVRWPWW